MATITSKGQITVPKEVREALGLVPGTELEFEVTGEQAVLRKRVPRVAFDKWRGVLNRGAPRQRTDELMRELRGE